MKQARFLKNNLIVETLKTYSNFPPFKSTMLKTEELNSLRATR